MKYLLISYLLFLVSHSSLGHPGIGIVKDSRGNIYYTDVKQVWKIDPVTGKKSIAVPNVHTHELYMDSADNLYGEHLWYNGERLNTWGFHVWCLKKDGSLVKEIDSQEGFLKDYSFVRDAAGNMYWADRSGTIQIKKKNKEGVITTIAPGPFNDIRWMYSNQEGEVFFVDLVDLYKIELSGRLKLLAKGGHGLMKGITADRHAKMTGNVIRFTSRN